MRSGGHLVYFGLVTLLAGCGGATSGGSAPMEMDRGVLPDGATAGGASAKGSETSATPSGTGGFAEWAGSVAGTRGTVGAEAVFDGMGGVPFKGMGGVPSHVGGGAFDAGEGTSTESPRTLHLTPQTDEAYTLALFASRVDSAPMLSEAPVSGAIRVEEEPNSLVAGAMVDQNGDVAVSGLGTCGVSTRSSAPRILIVPSGIATIQAAIDAASYGDTVFVEAGVYRENLSLRSGVKLVGAGAFQTVLDGSGAPRSLIDFSGAQDALVRGFTLQNVGQGLGCADPSDVTRCSGNWYAAGVYGGGDGWVDCDQPSLLFTQNIVRGNDIGMLLYFHARAIVVNNVFVANQHGFVANHHQDRSLVAHNVFFGNGAEAIVGQASYLDVLNNVFVSNGVAYQRHYVQRGFVGCNVLYGNASLGSGFDAGDDNLALDPRLLDPDSGDFRLGDDSPALTGGCFGSELALPAAAGAFGGVLGAWFERAIPSP